MRFLVAYKLAHEEFEDTIIGDNDTEDSDVDDNDGAEDVDTRPSERREEYKRGQPGIAPPVDNIPYRNLH